MKPLALVISCFLVVGVYAVAQREKRATTKTKSNNGVHVLKLESDGKDLTCSTVEDDTYAITSLDAIESAPTKLTITGYLTNATVVGIHTDMRIAVLKLGRDIFDSRVTAPSTSAIAGKSGFTCGVPSTHLDGVYKEIRVSGVHQRSGTTFINFRGELDRGVLGGTLCTGKAPNIKRIGIIIHVSSDDSPHVAVSATDALAFAARVRANVEKNLNTKLRIGTLGQTRRPTKIYEEMSETSKVFHSCDEAEYLVINDVGNEKFWSVLLQNGSQGYILKSDVLVRSYNITANERRMGVLVKGAAPMSAALKEYVLGAKGN